MIEQRYMTIYIYVNIYIYIYNTAEHALEFG